MTLEYRRVRRKNINSFLQLTLSSRSPQWFLKLPIARAARATYRLHWRARLPIFTTFILLTPSLTAKQQHSDALSPCCKETKTKTRDIRNNTDQKHCCIVLTDIGQCTSTFAPELIKPVVFLGRSLSNMTQNHDVSLMWHREYRYSVAIGSHAKKQISRVLFEDFTEFI